jgi:hypothetical protein
MIGAARLNVNIYEEVEADTTATRQAMGVVVLASLAAGIGTFATGGVLGIVMGTLTALIGWYVWAYLTFIIGTRFLAEPQTEADVGQLLRTIGFSASPGLLRVLGIIPGLYAPLFFVIWLWMLVSMIIAVRQALDYTSTFRAVVVCLIGWVIQLLLYALFHAIFGGVA